MAAVRESSFLPTIKCSSCLKQVEISLMGEHICSGPSAELSPPPDPQEGFGSYNHVQAEKPARTPPFLDTQAANVAFLREGQLTPNSLISEPRSTSPISINTRQTPTEDYFAPRSDSQNALATSPRDIKRPSVQNHFIDYERADLEPRSISESPTTIGNSTLMQRMNSITPGPFDATRRPARVVSGRNAFAPRKSSVGRMEDLPEAPSKDTSSSDRPGTATSTTSTSSSGNVVPPRMPQKSAYEGFGPPTKTEEDSSEPQPLGLINRSETFPKPSAPTEPVRTLSTPGSRPDRLKKQSILEEGKRPSMGPDTSRAPPRKSVIRPLTGKFMGSVDLAAEFGVNNPYHTPSDSGSSGYSTFSHPSRSSSQTSPAKSQPGRQPSDSSNIDDLMNDLQSSIESLSSKDLRIDVPPPPRTRSPLAESPFEMSPRQERYDPAIQNGQPTPQSHEQPLLSPHLAISRDRQSFDPAIQEVRQNEPSPRKYDQPPPSTRRYDQPLASPQYSTSPQYTTSPQYGTPPQYGTSPRDQHPASAMQNARRPENSPPAIPQPLRKGSRDPTAPRGDCKACKLPIKGKSISSADGRLTGKYHKACFVCSTCSEPFTSAEFYVLNDKPYCEQHYHKLNGSLCGSCGRGIEGQYLEDEFEIKYHIGCFRCLDCGRSLSEGYFEVDGKSYCERDAWRRVQQPWLTGKGLKGEPDSSLHPPPRGGPRHSKGHGMGTHAGHSAHRPSGQTMGLPRPPYGLPSGNRLSPDMAFTPRMNKRNTRLGMM